MKILDILMITSPQIRTIITLVGLSLTSLLAHQEKMWVMLKFSIY